MIKQVSYVKQVNQTECGIACLLSIAQFYGIRVPREWLYKESGYDRSGVSMYGLMQAANHLGFRVEAKEGDVSYLPFESVPFIAHTHLKENKDLYHFVVVVEVGKSKIKIMDPALGYDKVSYDEFREISMNHYLFLYKTSQLKSITIHQNLKSITCHFFRSKFFLFFFLLLFILIGLLLEFGTLFQFKILINLSLLPQSITNVCSLGIVFFEIAFLKCFLNYVVMRYQLHLQSQLSKQIKYKFFQQFLTLPLQYYQLRESGAILSFIDDIEFVSQFQSSSIYLLIYHSLLLLFLYCYVSYLSSSMSCILLISHLLFTLCILYEKRLQRKLYEIFHIEKLKKNRLYMMLFHSIETIKAIHVERKIKRVIFKQEEDFWSLQMKLEDRKYKQQSVFSFLESGVYLSVVCSSIYLFICGTLSISLSTFILLEGFIIGILRNYNRLLFWYLERQIYQEAVLRLDEFFSCQPEKLLFHKQFAFHDTIEEIKVCNLSFSYNEHLILKKVNLSIYAKDKIFLFGDSGSGKSTFLKLLCRHYPISYGMIQINQRDLVHYNLDTLRNMISYIHFYETIMADSLENVILFHRKKNLKRLEQVIWVCGIDEMMKKRGYTKQTYILENGSNLSCGERQRLLLARGLYQESELYILDECLSMVDLEVEEKILERLQNAFANKIIIYVSHRVQHKNLFNRKVYMKEGCCYEEK